MKRRRKPPPPMARVDIQGAAVVWWADLYARAEELHGELSDPARGELLARLHDVPDVHRAVGRLLDSLLAAMPTGRCALKLPAGKGGRTDG